jgi:gliding motility-associated-like protein
MKKILLLIFCVSFISGVRATHLIGGEMRYEYIGPGAAANSKQYRIRLLLFRGPGGATFISQYIVGVFNNDNTVKVPGPAENSNWAAVQDFATPLPVPINISPCIQFPPNLNYTYKTYSFIIELPDNNSGYTVAFQTYSRQFAQNISNDQGANYLCVIPGLNTVANPNTDNSPSFSLPVNVICANSNFTLDFSATDAPTDSLVYSFCNAYNGGAAGLADFRAPAPPPYSSVNYTNPFNGLSPMGPLATINSRTGVISGVAPNAGNYVVCVCIAVYRNGVFIATHRKDLIVQVSGCIPTQANAMPGFTTCDGFNIQFNHTSTGATSVFWDFGDPNTLADTSTLDNPVYVYPDTGSYVIKLIINKGGNCTDSATRTIGVYPGFFPGFEAVAPLCVGVPIRFSDTSNTRYGVINTWQWNFGDPPTLADTSRLQNPTYTFTTAGTYNARLIVSNSKGCIDTVFRNFTVLNKPLLSAVSNDTTYCRLDSLQLTATGTGNFTWSPATNIIGANTATPRVFPGAATAYFVTLENQGCISRDTVLLSPVNDVTNSITAVPASICQEDTLTLTGVSNKTANLRWQWSPTASVSNPLSQVTRAFPSVTSTYNLQTVWGNNCIANASVTIPVIPLAVPNAGPDTAFCLQQAAIQLSASGGNTYSWSPSTGLSNTNTANPIASPIVTTSYVVSVGVTGCSKTKSDTVVVAVRPKPVISVTNDTLICIIDTLQLNVSGNGSVVWTPDYMINNTGSPTPMVSPDLTTLYRVRLRDSFGCYSDDSVLVNVKSQVTINAGPDTSICRKEGFTMRASGDALTYTWSPATYLSSSTIKNPFANPPVTTTYTLTGNIGNCESQSVITVKVAPYPAAFAGADTTICIGFDAQLNATGGSSYEWSPALFLNNRFIPNPLSQKPPADIRYVVTVRDTLGCPAAIKDTVLVRVIQALNVDAGTSDTSIVEDEPLQLRATGAMTYSWTPPTWLNDTRSANPISNPRDSIKYFLTGTDVNGCTGSDSIMVRLYRVDEDLYVPNAFSPNGDGLNENFRPILLGMKSLSYFRVYNRFGELVFSTSQVDKGWDGTFKGKPQNIGTYVWMAAGITYKNQLRRKKGYVILIR